jgi:serine/threonine protein kinase
MTPTHEYLVMELVGKSIAELRSSMGGQFSLSTGIRLAIKTLKTIADCHFAGIVHGDIKPGNVAMGVGENSRHCYIIDFGLSRQFPQEEHKANFRGTVKYASIHSHEHLNLTARDDLWSWLYMVCEWLHGGLPWSHLCLQTMQPRNEVYDVKKDFSDGSLVSSLPPQFYAIHQHLASLHFFDFPNYPFISAMLEEALLTVGGNWSAPYDWETPEGQARALQYRSTFGLHPYVPTGALGRVNMAEAPKGTYLEDQHLRYLNFFHNPDLDYHYFFFFFF